MTDEMTLEDLIFRLHLIEAMLSEAFSFDLVNDRDFALSEISAKADLMVGRKPRKYSPPIHYDTHSKEHA